MNQTQVSIDTVKYKVALWQVWQAESDKLATEILAENNGISFDVEGAWREARAELEGRHDFLFDFPH